MIKLRGKNKLTLAGFIIATCLLLSSCSQQVEVTLETQDEPLERYESALSSKQDALEALANDSNWARSTMTFASCSFNETLKASSEVIDDEAASELTRPTMEAWGILQGGSPVELIDVYAEALIKFGYNVANPVLDSKSLDDPSRIISVTATAEDGQRIVISIDESLVIKSIVELSCDAYESNKITSGVDESE